MVVMMMVMMNSGDHDCATVGGVIDKSEDRANDDDGDFSHRIGLDSGRMGITLLISSTVTNKHIPPPIPPYL